MLVLSLSVAEIWIVLSVREAIHKQNIICGLYGAGDLVVVSSSQKKGKKTENKLN